MEGEGLPKPFFSLLSQAAEEVRRHAEVRVLTHYDADGISSAGIIANTLLRKGIRFQLTLSKSLEAETLESVGKGAKCLILADMGSSFLTELERLDASVIVLDHHAPTGSSTKVIHVNPHLFGIDGMTSGCAGAVSMMFALAMDERNWDLLPIAFAGIVGDRQHIRGLSGVNKWLLDGGLSRKVLELRPGSLLPEGKLAEELAGGFEPFIIGVSGDLRGAMTMLKEAGLPEDASLVQLNETEKRRLTSLVAVRLLEQGCTTSSMEEQITDRYFFSSWQTTADELAQLLNACGRRDQEGVGVALTLRDAKAMQAAERLRKEYKESMLDAMLAIVSQGVRRKENLQYFISTNPSLSGALAGLTMQFVGDCDRPTIALSMQGEKVRISSRANFRLVEKGVDLSTALREAASAVGGQGGGHAVASGATIAKGKEETFLEKLDEIIGRQRAAKAAV
ncbi:MAG: DHH family phosphoesterase [Methanomassiliicoccales archaeon]|nr:DHH family phosphoesterase [Methanomassiliicoccales archaeon]MDD1756013.1 DHH family phosphoesterase [Methanomassiliicoccales archaeon]